VAAPLAALPTAAGGGAAVRLMHAAAAAITHTRSKESL
jgi:hypothetical protein